MSPASQGSLEVERYIGSCLISSSVRSSNTTSNNSTVNHHPKGLKKGTCPSNHHYRHNNYNGVPLCECGANTRYGSAGRSWAGMPLISMASTGSRRNRKSSTSTPAGRTGKGSCKGVDGEQTRTPLSRLAIHTQGAPLILAGRYSSNNNNNTTSKGPPVRQHPARKYNNGTINNSKEIIEKNSVPGSTSATPNSSDTLSVASDESSGHSENSLPRIIKPRKRRKKDRKPPPSANISPSEATKSVSPSSESKNQESSNIVTLKPYVPLCYDIYKGSKVCGVPCVVDDERASQTSEEDAHDVKLHHEFDDVEGEDDNVALFPYPVCQCSYCDPAGLIWDVDQHCYSPFLTPPSPDSPFTNIPFFSSPPPTSTELHSFSLFSNNDASPASTTEKDTCSGLRRSWSDPSASPSHRVPFCSSSQSLEVSTEIVTSPNGHRDIEIKFYSSSPPSAVPAQDNSEKVKFRWGSEPGGLWGTASDLGEEVKQLRLQVEE
ncbi:uncharacterized protein [Anabrus simplex]|uniref:uncharacterized protein n=1 Tax=Anabrus simplex TaxID=316456 RepID=UPI0035A366D4